VARALARRLGFEYLDTGATYRAVALKAMKDGVDFGCPRAIARAARQARIEFVPADGERRVLCDGADVTDEIRRSDVTEKVRWIADEPEARRALIGLQRRLAEGRDLVSEGRDQGTEVFPDAEVKFYLDASLQARAARRMRDLRRIGEEARLEEVRHLIAERDRADLSRPMGRLRRTDDMIVIDSTKLSVEQVVSRMVQEVERLKARATPGAGQSSGERV